MPRDEVDDARAVGAPALAAEDVPVDARLEAVLERGESFEVEVEKAFAVAIVETREEVSYDARPGAMRMRGWAEEAKQSAQRRQLVDRGQSRGTQLSSAFACFYNRGECPSLGGAGGQPATRSQSCPSRVAGYCQLQETGSLVRCGRWTRCCTT